MDITSHVKDELLAAQPTRQDQIRAELASLVRLGISEPLSPDAIVCDYDTQSVASYMARLMASEFGCRNIHVTDVVTSSRKPPRYQVTISDRVPTILRELGLVTRSGIPVIGMPPAIVSGSVVEAEAVWRGAVLARGAITDPGRSSALEVVCPGPEVAMAIVGFARRLGITAKAKDTRGADRVQVKDPDSVSALLTRLRAHRSRMEWEEHRIARQSTASTHRLVNFDDANTRRSAKAAEHSAARAERALEILGDDVPAHLADAGALRVQHRQASLEELGHLAEPQLTKDAIAGRIRRLFSMADKRAKELGIPDTNDAARAVLRADDEDGAESTAGE